MTLVNIMALLAFILMMLVCLGGLWLYYDMYQELKRRGDEDD